MTIDLLLTRPLKREHTEEEVVRLLKQGGTEAERVYEVFYKAHAPQLEWYIFKYVRDTQEAKDIVQHVLGEKILTNLDALVASAEEGRLRLKGWLYTVARNLALNYVRDKKRRKTEPTDDVNVIYVQQNARQDHEDTILRRVFENEARNYIDERLDEVSKEHREILILRYRHDLSYNEISERLGIKLGTVMSRLSRARDSIQNKMKEADKTVSWYQPLRKEIHEGFE